MVSSTMIPRALLFVLLLGSAQALMGPLSTSVRRSRVLEQYPARGLDVSDVLETNSEDMSEFITSLESEMGESPEGTERREEIFEFINSLRSQMNNTLNASPRAMTNRIKAFFSTRRGRTSEEVEVFGSYLVENREIMDVVSTILLLEGCGRMSLPVNKLVGDYEILVNGMSRPSPMLTSSMLYRGITYLKVSKEASVFRDAAGQAFSFQFMDLLLMRAEECGTLLNEIDVCPAISQLSQLNSGSGTVRRLVDICTRSLAATQANIPSKTMCSAVYGLRKMNAESTQVLGLLAEITNKIRSSESLYHPINVCIALNGLQSMSDASPEVRGLVDALLAQSIMADEQGIDRVTDREISMALMGLKEMGGAHGDVSLREGHKSEASKELRAALRYISALLEDYTQPFQAKRLSFALLGLQGLRCRTPEVRRIVDLIATKAATCEGTLTGQETSMIIRGLSGLDTDEVHVRRLLRYIVPLVRECSHWESSDCQSALMGLRGLKHTSIEANKLAEAVAELIDRSNERLASRGVDGGSQQGRCLGLNSPEQVGLCLHALQGLGTMTPEARLLLSKMPALIAQVPRNQQAFTGRSFGMALYGLRSASCQFKETKSVLAALMPFVQNQKGYVSSQHVTTALSGMQCLDSNTAAVRSFLVAAAPLLARSSGGGVSPKAVSGALSGLQRMRSQHVETHAVFESLAAVLERSGDEFLQAAPRLGSFAGFDDFYQLSTAISGLAGKEVAEPSVQRLGSAFARLLRKHVGEGVAGVVGGAGGGGMGGAGGGEGGGGERDKERERGDRDRDRDRGSSKRSVTPERLSLAFFAMQGLGASVPESPDGPANAPAPRKAALKQASFAVTLMEALLPALQSYASPLTAAAGGTGTGTGTDTGSGSGSGSVNVKELGKMYQAFKGVVVPSDPYTAALELLATRLEHCRNFPKTEAQASLRSILTGISSLRRDLPVRLRTLRLLSVEVRSWPADQVERRTLEALSNAFFYRGSLQKVFATDGLSAVHRREFAEFSAEAEALAAALDAQFKANSLGQYFRAYVRPDKADNDKKAGSTSAVKAWSKGGAEGTAASQDKGTAKAWSKGGAEGTAASQDKGSSGSVQKRREVIAATTSL